MHKKKEILMIQLPPKDKRHLPSEYYEENVSKDFVRNHKISYYMPDSHSHWYKNKEDMKTQLV